MIKPNKTFILSDESVNSHGFRVITSGIDLIDFIKNPVMLRNHEGDAIGFWENIRVEDNKLLAEPVFSESDDLAIQTAEKVADGTLKAASIGIENAVFTYDTKYNVDRAEHGAIISCKIFEASIVEFPSNSNALVLYDEKRNAIKMNWRNVSDYASNHLFTNRNKIKMNKETLKLLHLNDDANVTDVHNAVTQLLNKLQGYESEMGQYRDARNTEVVNAAISLGKITYKQADTYKLLLERDFNNTKSLLDSIPVPESVKFTKNVSITDLIKNSKKQNADDEKEDQSKPPVDKSKWSLNHYRKFAPQELRNNPNLAQQLLEKEKIATKA